MPLKTIDCSDVFGYISCGNSPLRKIHDFRNAGRGFKETQRSHRSYYLLRYTSKNLTMV